MTMARTKTTEVRTFSSNNELVAERRDQIARAAQELLLKRGLQKTGIREIARASNMTIGNLYHYIGKREDIIYLALNTGISQYRKVLKEMNERCEAMPPREALVWAIDRYYRYQHEDRVSTAFAFREMSSFDPALFQYVLEAEAATNEVFEKILKRGCAEGIFAINSVVLVANTITTMGEMWAVKRFLYKKRYSLDEYIQLNTELVLKQICTVTK
jgi:TetR/AcrR family transcriptional regulator, cholesterol catabolism regulator